MKITKAALKQLIREEITNSLEEAEVSPAAYARQLGGAEGAAAFEAGEGPQTYGGDHAASDAKFLKLIDAEVKKFLVALDKIQRQTRSKEVQKKADILKSLMKKTIVGAFYDKSGKPIKMFNEPGAETVPPGTFGPE